MVISDDQTLRRAMRLLLDETTLNMPKIKTKSNAQQGEPRRTDTETDGRGIA
jgi:hypothetical protein